jgi:hypothetical protein
MKTCFFLGAFSLLCLVFPAGSQQPLVGLIQGTVKNQQGAPIADVNLTATNIDSVEPESSRRSSGTDRQGTFQFIQMSPGRYSIVAQRNGYRDYKVPLVNVYPGETVTMPEIKMSPAGRRSGS